MIFNSIPNGFPVANSRVTSLFGMREHPILKKMKMHQGMDFSCRTGAPIISTANGLVEKTKSSDQGYGKVIVVRHDYGFSTIYAHLDSFKMSEGDFVSKGQVIAYCGNSGQSTASHLHYEIRYLERPLDPENFVYWNRDEFSSIFIKESRVKWDFLVKKIKILVAKIRQPLSPEELLQKVK
ncbi:peptidase M23/M37 family [Vibrio ponticus]|nr:peptidase M23/M37 family [Vibrio ponticus]